MIGAMDRSLNRGRLQRRTLLDVESIHSTTSYSLIGRSHSLGLRNAPDIMDYLTVGLTSSYRKTTSARSHASVRLPS